MPASPEERLAETPLVSRHHDLGAKMAPFAGYLMPLSYRGVIEEHRAVRQACGLFDVSHMGTVFVSGADTAGFLQRTLTNDITKVPPGKAQYTLLCNEDGGVIDDLIVSHLAEQEWMIVPNAANIALVVSTLEAAAPTTVDIANVSRDWGILAIQGPRFREVVDSVLPDGEIGRFAVRRFETQTSLTGVVSGTGYTGSPGVEIIAPARTIVSIWDAAQPALENVDGQPVGLGARDMLRLEMGYPLHGQDISPTISPLEARLGWVVKLDKGDFPGSDALRRQKEEGPRRRTVGFLTPDRRPPRPHCRVLDAGGDDVGEVTSGNYSPLLERGMGLALVTTESDPVAVDIRGRTIDIDVVTPPFIDLST